MTYPTRCVKLPAFDLVGFTQIVQSGGALYEAARSDGRWEVLRSVGGADGTIYGVASYDKECPEGSYRYTLAVKARVDDFAGSGRHDELFSMRIPESDWVVFVLDHFGAQYGKFWEDDPYALIQELGWSFNAKVGLHLDAFGPAYSSDDDAMEFLMPVSPRA